MLRSKRVYQLGLEIIPGAFAAIGITWYFYQAALAKPVNKIDSVESF